MPEKDENQKKQAEKKRESDLGSGKGALSTIFQGIGNIIDLVANMEEEGKVEERREGEFSSPSGRVKGVFGISVKTGLGLDEKLTIEPQSHVRKAPQRPRGGEERQPLIDVFDGQDHVLVIIELPGVDEEQIHTEVKGDILILSTTSGNYNFYREVILPKDVDASTVTRKYTNGVLEIRISKK